jgi:hypothetical protein
MPSQASVFQGGGLRCAGKHCNVMAGVCEVACKDGAYLPAAAWDEDVYERIVATILDLVQ